MDLLIGGRWTASRSGETEEVRSPFDGSVVGEVPTAGPADVELALAAAECNAGVWRRTPAHERIAAVLSAENGKRAERASWRPKGAGERAHPRLAPTWPDRQPG